MPAPHTSCPPRLRPSVPLPLSQSDLVDHLVASGVVHSARVKSVMRMVDRKHFVGPHAQFYGAYLVGGCAACPLVHCLHACLHASGGRQGCG